jgi:HEAT repeat protein
MARCWRLLKWGVALAFLFGCYQVFGKAVLIHILGKHNLISTETIIGCLDDHSELTRSTAMSVLVMKGRDSIPALVAALRTRESDEVRAASAWALGQIVVRTPKLGEGKEREQARTALQQALHDDSRLVRVRAAHAHWRVERDSEKIIQALIEGWLDPGLSTKYCAFQALSEMGAAAEKALPVLTNNEGQTTELTRVWATRAIESIRASECESPHKDRGGK